MNWKAIVERIDARTAQAFVRAAGHFIDAVLIESERVSATRTPGRRDYQCGALSDGTPPGGWIAPEELRAGTQRMSEAIAAEKWVEGAVFAIAALAALGA